MIQRPSDNQKCSGCSHPFSEHYTTYGGTAAGCSHYIDSQRDGGHCYCKGFAMTWQPASTQEPAR